MRTGKLRPALVSRGCIKPARDALAIECRRHDDETQIGTQAGLCIERKRGTEIAVQMAFVKLVEQDRTDTGQGRIVLQHARENAFGDHFDARVRRRLSIRNGFDSRSFRRRARRAVRP